MLTKVTWKLTLQESIHVAEHSTIYGNYGLLCTVVIHKQNASLKFLIFFRAYPAHTYSGPVHWR